LLPALALPGAAAADKPVLVSASPYLAPAPEPRALLCGSLRFTPRWPSAPRCFVMGAQLFGHKFSLAFYPAASLRFGSLCWLGSDLWSRLASRKSDG